MTAIQIWLSRGDELSHEAALQRRVWEELGCEPLLDTAGISVDVGGRAATLRGTVTSYPQKLAAERAAKRVAGLQGVCNEVAVALPLLLQRSDDDLARALARVLEWNVVVPAGGVWSRVEGGWVTLEGTASSDQQRHAAEQAVEPLAGVRGITNLIAVLPPAPPDDLKSRVDAALQRRAALHKDRIRVEARGATLVLRGHVHSIAERDEAEQTAWSVPGVAAVADQLTVDE